MWTAQMVRLRLPDVWVSLPESTSLIRGSLEPWDESRLAVEATVDGVWCWQLIAVTTILRALNTGRILLLRHRD